MAVDLVAFITEWRHIRVYGISAYTLSWKYKYVFRKWRKR